MLLLAVREGLFVTITMGSNNGIGLAEISAFLAALGIVIYALGMVALCWPIYQRITHDASTALYAVSLMPKTVVAGQGVRLLFGLPFFNTIVFSVLVIVQHVLTTSLYQVIPGVPSRLVIIGVLVLMLGVLYIIVRRTKTVVAAFLPQGTGFWAGSLAMLTSIIAGLGTALLVASTLFKSDEILPQLPGWEPLRNAMIVIFLLNCCTAFIYAFTGDPPLPEISLNGATMAEGKLVTHADGVWYILDDKGNLVGIPDDKAGWVLVSPNSKKLKATEKLKATLQRRARTS